MKQTLSKLRNHDGGKIELGGFARLGYVVYVIIV
jgi:hypothetical protein